MKAVKSRSNASQIEALEVRRLFDIAADRFEPNNSFAQATSFGVLGHRVENDLTVHVANDDDYFSFVPDLSGVATVSIAFTHAQGDLDLLLYNSAHQIIGSSTGITNSETIVKSLTAGQTYFVLVFESNSGTSPDYDLTIDAPAHPAVTSSAFDFQSSHKLLFTFNKDVQASLQPSDVSVVDSMSNPVTGPMSVSYDSGTNTATFSFEGILADGNYTATLSGAGVDDGLGHTMASDATLPFFVLTADANHSRTVDTIDFNILVSNFSQTGKTFSQGNFNYDPFGSVDTIDFNLLVSKFSQSLAPAAPAAPAAAAQQAMLFSSAQISPMQHKDIDDLAVVGVGPAVD